MNKLPAILLSAFILAITACDGYVDPKTQLDNLEKVFEAGNWRLKTANNDTFYLFFSREGDRLFKVYHYALKNGDSVQTVVSTIQPKSSEVVWDLQYQHITLKDADEKGSSWQGRYMGNVKYTKLDSASIVCTWGEGNADTLMRTLPISTFLIRAKYDHLHGTNTANATVDTLRKPIKPVIKQVVNLFYLQLAYE